MSHRTTVLIVSPSGNLYGSERVLYDYLAHTRHDVNVAVPSGSSFHALLKVNQGRYGILPFDLRFLKWFYAKVFWDLLIRKYSSVYLNEGGHVRYMKLLAQIFPNIPFIIHIRIMDDVDKKRWGRSIPDNMRAVTISAFMQRMMPVNSVWAYDPYPFEDRTWANPIIRDGQPLRVGLVGRVTGPKGIGTFFRLLEHLSLIGDIDRYDFSLFGDVSDDMKDSPELIRFSRMSNVHFMGFKADKRAIYSELDCILHCTPAEPLGRIYLESLDAGIPFVGILAGGIGEMGEMLGLSDLLTVNDEDNLTEGLADKLNSVASDPVRYTGMIAIAREKAKMIFDNFKYAATIDGLLS